MTDKRILITGAAGFIGKNLCAELANRGYKNLLLFDVNNSDEDLAKFCSEADFVYHLAGINRPKDSSEFYSGNSGFTDKLLSMLRASNSTAPFVVTSSIQATLDNDYGKSKAISEQAIFDYGNQTNVPVYVFRLVGVFGKWCRPNYNSVVATFCNNIANDLPIQISNPDACLNLCYIDDVVVNLISLLETENHVTSEIPLQIKPEYTVTLNELATIIKSFKDCREIAFVPNVNGEFERKLYGTYTSYLPQTEYSYQLKNNIDNRGHLSEFLKNDSFGQLFVSTTKPGITRGNHWHHTKTEKFFVVYGQALIKIRRIDSDVITEIVVDGETPTVIDIPTGHTHNITNIGNGDLVTLFWSSEILDKDRPDTYFMEV